ncbi:DUF308 domain-containing protein [Bradyrhizobium sp. CER78]|uniref:DUF308 domain-containing protein n=1 Tax=Bradyrhizobium sp. CER78 TaxID=3039162 RepID=UPI0032647BA3
MATTDNSSALGLTGIAPPPLWMCVLLGIAMIVAGVLVLGDVVLFTVVSAIFIGWTAIFAGGFEIVHAFWTKGWEVSCGSCCSEPSTLHPESCC